LVGLEELSRVPGIEVEFDDGNAVLSVVVDDRSDETTCWVTVVVNVVQRNVDPGECGGNWVFDFVFECA